jgi:hypothetical protein
VFGGKRLQRYQHTTITDLSALLQAQKHKQRRSLPQLKWQLYA